MDLYFKLKAIEEIASWVVIVVGIVFLIWIWRKR